MKPFLNLLLFSLLSVTINGQVRNLVTERVYIRDSLRLKNRSIHEISIDATFSSATDKILATQKAIKDYVQNQIGNIDSLVKASNATGLFTPGHIPYIEGTGRLNARSFVELGAQSAPAAPSGGVRLFANGSNQLSWIGVDGYSRSFNGTMTGDRVYTLQDATGTLAMLGVAQTWTGVQTFAPSGSGGAALVVNTTNMASRPIPPMTSAQMNALTGNVFGDMVANITTGQLALYNSGWFSIPTLQSGGIAANYVIRSGGVNAPQTGDNKLIFDGSNGQFLINSFGSLHAFSHAQSTNVHMLYIQGPSVSGAAAYFSLYAGPVNRPKAIRVGMGDAYLDAYDGRLYLSESAYTYGSNGLYSLRGFGLGTTLGPSNVSYLSINSTSTSEYNTGSSYPSGVNYYQIATSLSSVGTSQNGFTGVRSGLRISGRYLALEGVQGVLIGSSTATSVPNTAAALDVNRSDGGFLPPRGAATSNLRYGLAAIQIVNGGSGYGTGAGVTISISGGGGSGAAISLTYSGGVITGGTVLLKGYGYSSAPTISISGGTGSGAVITCTLESTPNGLEYYNTTTNRKQIFRSNFFDNEAYLTDIKRDTSYKVVNANLDLSGQTTFFKNNYHTVRITTIVTAAAAGNNTITMPVPSVDLLGINFKVAIEDTSGDGDISVLQFGTDGSDGYLYNGDGTYDSSQNLFPGLGVYISVAWCEAKGAYRWVLQ